MMIYQHTKFNLKTVKWFRRYHQDKYSMRIWTLTTVTLTVMAATQHCYTTLQLVMMHHYIKSGWKDSEVHEIWKKVIFEDLSPHCDLDLEDRNLTFSHDTLGHDDAPSYPVSLKKVLVQKILSRQILPKDENPHCDLDLEDSNPKLSHNTPHDDAPLHQIWLQKFPWYGRKLFLEDLSQQCAWPWRQEPNRFAWQLTLQVMMRWWCTIIPSLVAYSLVVWKITSRQWCGRQTLVLIYPPPSPPPTSLQGV